jgi:shikimate dehydrogenase
VSIITLSPAGAGAAAASPGALATTRATPTMRPLVGLIGAGIQRSLSPAMHEEEARCQGLALRYQLIDLDRTGAGPEALPTLLAAARLMDFAGLNVTFPCKQAILPLLDGLSDEARTMGAVNTVVAREGRWVGHNTDGSGWAWGLHRALPHPDLGRVVVQGTGGAGSAIAHALRRLQAEVLVLVDTDPARADALAASLRAAGGRTRVETATDIARALQGANGLVHATPTGMDKLPGLPLDPALLHPGLWVSEVVYFPLDTALLRAARERGCRTVDGGTMAVGQALGAFELFTGRSADPVRVEAHFRRMIAARAASE